MRTTFALALAALSLCACSNTLYRGAPPPGGGTVGGSDGGDQTPVDMLPAWNGSCDDTHACPKGQRCFQSSCIADNGTCQSDDDCENDSYCDCTGGGGGDAGACMGGVCIPWGVGPRGSFDPTCQTQGFSATQFVAPKIKCQWGAGDTTSGTLVTPIVADLDGDKIPEIVFESYPGRFTALHGKDCSVYFDTMYNFQTQNQSQLAVADLDADGIPEIIGVDANSQIVVFDNKGNQLAISSTPYQQTFPASGGLDWGGPAIVDVDNTAPPEIVMAGQVARYHKGNPQLEVLWTQSPDVPYFGSLTIAADLDGDGKPEVIAGKEIYDGITGGDKTPSMLKQLQGVGAFPAIGDFNADGKPDIVLVQSVQGMQRVSVFDYTHNTFLFGPYDVPNGWGGPPTVADFDGDGKPEFASAGFDWYYVFDLKCAVQNKPAFCDQSSNYGVRWMKKTQDHSSGSTGSSVFDFNGDGIAEVVYRDECWLRVYEGPDGKTLFAADVTSATALELPVVADVDNDGHAEIVVTSDSYNTFSGCPGTPEPDTNTPWMGNTTGIFIYEDPMQRWMPSRSVWNQHSYHITNVKDDLTIPTMEQPNWLTFNNYRQNVQGLVAGKPTDQSDYTGGVATTIDNNQGDCRMVWTLRANLCNRGPAPAAAGVPGTFYSSDPRQPNAQKICTTTTQNALNPGQCETVSCDWMNPPQMPTDLWFRADDDGNGNKPDSECKRMNDILFMPQAQCGTIG